MRKDIYPPLLEVGNAMGFTKQETFKHQAEIKKTSAYVYCSLFYELKSVFNMICQELKINTLIFKISKLFK